LPVATEKDILSDVHRCGWQQPIQYNELTHYLYKDTRAGGQGHSGVTLRSQMTTP